MNINSTSSYVNNASSSNGFSGLASGLDTESMVEKMLANVQAKIDKQNGLKQQVEWKQEIYREIITQINSFQSQFFGSSSTTNFMNQAFFNAMKAITSSNAFKVNATSSAATGNVDLEVRQMATSTSITSSAGVSGKLAGTVDAQAIKELADKQLNGDYTVKLEVDGKTVTADLKDVFVDEATGTFKTYSSTAERDAAIQTKLNNAFKDTSVKVDVKDGAVSFKTDGKKTISVVKGSGEMGLQRLGLTSGMQSTTKNGEATLSGKIDDKPSISFSVTLDDLQKEVKIDLRNIMDGNGNVDVSKFATELQNGLDKAHGKGQIKAEFNGNNFELKVSNGRKVMLGGSKEVLDTMGVKNGQSNRIGMGGSLKDLYFANKLQGSSFKFTINDVEFSFDENDTMSDIVSAINRSGAGVRLVYRVQDDSFTLEASESGAGREITMSQTEGNLLNALFGSGADGNLATGSKAVSSKLTFGQITGNSPLADDATIDQGKFTINVNGTEHSFSIPKKEGKTYTKDEVIKELNTQMDKAFGTGNINLDKDGNLVVNNGAAVTVKSSVSKPDDPAIVEAAAKAGDLNAAFFGGKTVSNVATGETTLAQMGLTGLKDKDGNALDSATKLSELAEKTGGVLSFEDGRITASGDVMSVVDENDKSAMQKLFGTPDLVLGATQGDAATLKEGQNAIIKIDGVLTERSSNTFQVNGLDISLTGTTGNYVKGTADGNFKTIDSEGKDVEFPPEGVYIKDGKLYDAVTKQVKMDAQGNELTFPSWPKFIDANGNVVEGAAGMDKDGYLLDEDGNRIFEGKADKIEVTRNTDQIVDGVKQFIDGYNKLIKNLNDIIGEDRTYRKYDPLTEAQKKEMSEKEIELWEEKAKEGLLRNDSTIETFLQKMRTTLYEKPAGSDYALYDLGIDTGDWESKGQLILSADGEARLRQLLESDPSGVMKLFTDKEEGLAVKLNSIIDKTAKISSGSPGSLVELAGVKGKASEVNNTLYNRLKAIDDKIATLKRTYEKQKARYWNQFNAMEKAIANMNSQSSWLTQQLG